MDSQDHEEPVIGFDKLAEIKIADVKWIAIRSLVLGVVLFIAQYHLLPHPDLRKSMIFFGISYFIAFFLVFRWWYWSPRK